MKKNSNIINLFCIIAVLLISTIWVFSNIRFGCDSHHDGYLFLPSLIVSRGGVLFRDTTITYGPFTIYIQALFIYLFGESILITRISASIFWVLSFGGLYLILRRWLSNFTIMICMVVWLFLGTGYNTAWSSIYALFFSLIAAYFMLKYIDKRKTRDICFSTFGVAMTFFFRQPVGTVIFLSGICVFLLLFILNVTNPRIFFRDLTMYMLLTSFFVLPLLVYYFHTGLLQGWWHSNIDYMLSGGNMSGLRDESVLSLQNMLVSKAPGDKTIISVVKKEIYELLVSTPAFLKILKFSVCMIPFFPFNDKIIWWILPLVSIFIFFDLFIQLKSYYKKNKIVDLNENKNADEEKMKNKLLLAIFDIYAIASWAQYYPSSNHFHWYLSSFMMYGVCIIHFSNLIKTEAISKIKIGVICFVAILSVSQVYYSLYFHVAAGGISDELLGDVSLNNVVESHRYNSEIYENETFPYVNGLKISKEQVRFYDELASIILKIQEDYPSVQIVNKTELNLSKVYTLEQQEGDLEIIIDYASFGEEYIKKGYKVYDSLKITYRSPSYMEKEGEEITFYINNSKSK